MARLQAYRRYRAVMMHWTNVAGTDAKGEPRTLTGPAHHQSRVQRLRATWPQLTDALDLFAESVGQLEPAPPWNCPACGVPGEWVRQGVDPVRFAHTYEVHPCGDAITRDQAMDAFEHDLDVALTPINGATLAAAERVRQLQVKGYDLGHDLGQLSPGDLAWAAWCLLDRAAADPDRLTDEVPLMWPLGPEAWAKLIEKEPLRLLVIATALVCAEIDRHRASNPQPPEE